MRINRFGFSALALGSSDAGDVICCWEGGTGRGCQQNVASSVSGARQLCQGTGEQGLSSPSHTVCSTAAGQLGANFSLTIIFKIFNFIAA